MRASTLAIALLFACSSGGDDNSPGTDSGTVDTDVESDTDTDADADTDTDTDTPGCTASLTGIDPPNGSRTHAVDGDITVTFDAAIAVTDPYSITVVDALNQGAVSGVTTLAADGLSATFTPDDDLDYETDYEAAVGVCGMAVVSTFRTLLAPIDPTLAVGQTYEVPVQNLVWTQPTYGEFILITIDNFLLEVRDVDTNANTVDWVASSGFDYPPVTPACIGAIDPAPSDFSANPHTVIGPENLRYDYLYLYNGGGVLEDFRIEAQFNADASTLVDVRITALWDPEQFLPGLACGITAAVLMGVCAPCATAPGGQCIVVDATLQTALALPNTNVIATCGL